MKIFYEPQLSCQEGLWGWTLRIVRQDGNEEWSWTNQWAPLPMLEEQTFDAAKKEAIRQLVALDRVLKGSGIEQAPIKGDGMWQCPDGHLFRYEPPPAYPPWCGHPGCFAGGEITWIPE